MSLEPRIRERLDALGPAPRAELLHVLMLPDFERADGKGNPEGDPPSFGVPLRAVVPVGYGVGSVIDLP